MYHIMMLVNVCKQLYFYSGATLFPMLEKNILVLSTEGCEGCMVQEGKGERVKDALTCLVSPWSFTFSLRS